MRHLCVRACVCVCVCVIQNATLTTLPVAREEEVAALSWAVGKLVARRRLTQATTTPTPITTTITSTLASEQSVDEVVLPAWHAALTKVHAPRYYLIASSACMRPAAFARAPFV